MKYTFGETIYLKTFCELCKKKNGGCIKNQPKLGLCAENDADEIIEEYRKRLKTAGKLKWTLKTQKKE